MPLQNLTKSERTKKKLKKALIDLCYKKNYNDITIEDICKKVDTYRSTFYRYYDTKDQMLREIEKEYIQDTRDLTPTFSLLNSKQADRSYDILLKELTADMQYHHDHRKLCRFLLSPSGDPFFYRKMVESVSQLAGPLLMERQHSPEKTMHQYRLAFFSFGYISTIHEWLKRDDCSAEEIARILLQTLIDIGLC